MIPRRLLGLAPLLLAACAGDTPSDDDARSVTTSYDTVAGVVHVRNVGAPDPSAVREIVTIGSVGAADAAPDEFGRIAGVIADADGNIYVADGIANEVRVFDERGTFLRRFGRSGSGPGEFEGLLSIAWLGDTIATLDAGNGRMGLLSKDGQWLGQRGFMPLTGTGVHLRAAGPGEVYMPFLRADESGRLTSFFVRHRLDAAADTLANPRDERQGEYAIICFGEGSIGSFAPESAPTLIRTPAPDAQVAEAYSTDYRIAFIAGGAGGDTVRVVERDIARRPIPDAVWQEEQRRFDEWYEDWRDADCQSRSLTRPDAIEVIRTMGFDTNGNLWIERRTDDGYMLDRFDGDGRLVATLALPERARQQYVPLFVRGERVYLVVTDEMDVQYVKVIAAEGADGT